MHLAAQQLPLEVDHHQRLLIEEALAPPARGDQDLARREAHGEIAIGPCYQPALPGSAAELYQKPALA
jgi:hypothetical protein